MKTTIEALNLETSIDYVAKLQRLVSFSQLQLSAKQLHEVFTPSTVITHDKNKNFVTEITPQNKNAILQSLDAILIMGNNDLHQVDHVASLCKHFSPTTFPIIYISGRGGHGTVAGYIFGRTEAETIAQRLLDFGIPANKIVIEKNSTNTGENIRFVSDLILLNFAIDRAFCIENTNIQELDELKKALSDREFTPRQTKLLEKLHEYVRENQIVIHQNILLSTTPSGLLRQLFSFEKQSVLSWKNIISLPPTWDMIQSKYYAEPQSATINFLGLLREVATYFDYYISTNYVSSRAINSKNIETAISILTENYARMKHRRLDKNELCKSLIEFAKNKEMKPIDTADKSSDLYQCIKLMTDDFRQIFSNVEAQWMKSLPKEITFRAQAIKLDNDNRYNRLGLEAGFFASTLSEVQKNNFKDNQEGLKKALKVLKRY